MIPPNIHCKCEGNKKMYDSILNSWLLTLPMWIQRANPLYIKSTCMNIKYLWSTHETGDDSYLWKVDLQAKSGLPFCIDYIYVLCVCVCVSNLGIYIYTSHPFKIETATLEFRGSCFAINQKLCYLTSMQFSFPNVTQGGIIIWIIC